jgi:uncharacterized protein (DUF433 family)
MRDALECPAGGMSVNDILTELPDQKAEDIREFMAFAAESERLLWVI